MILILIHLLVKYFLSNCHQNERKFFKNFARFSNLTPLKLLIEKFIFNSKLRGGVGDSNKDAREKKEEILSPHRQIIC